MTDLVLATRVFVAKQNLERLQNLQDMVSRRYERVSAFLELPESLKQQVSDLYRQVLALKALDLPDGTPKELADGLQQMDVDLRAIRDDLEKRVKRVRRLREEFESLTNDRQDVDQFLVKAAEELHRTLTVENYWKQRKRCDALFSEYVDYLRGVAIRSTAFGDQEGLVSDLFVLADSLPALWGRPGGRTWKSLAVPSRVEQNEPTQASVLRIGFPEWTIWALPLLQHEFAHVVVEKNKGELAVVSRTERAILADALAGLVTGPAYACAQLLLRLDPTAVTKANALTALRSATILETMRRSAEAANDPALTVLVTRLGEEWSSVIASAGGDAAALDAARAAPEVASQIERAAAFLGLGDWTAADHLAPRWAERWATVVEWASKLTNGDPDEIGSGDADNRNGRLSEALGLLLDAAWLARVGPTPGADVSQDRLDTVAANTVARMREVVRASGHEAVINAVTTRTARS